MIKRIVVCGVINESLHVVYDIIVKAQRTSMLKVMVSVSWEEVAIDIYDVDQEILITIPRDWDRTVSLCNWLKDMYPPVQVLKSMPVRVGGGGVMEVIRLGYQREGG